MLIGHHSPVKGGVWSQSLEQNPWGWSSSCLLSLWVCAPHFLTMKCLLKWRSVLEQEDLSGTWYRPACVLVLCLHTNQSSSLSLLWTLVMAVPPYPRPDAGLGESQLCLPQLHISLHHSSLWPSGKLCWSSWCWSGCSVWSRACLGSVAGNWPESQALSICFLYFAPRSKHSSQANSRFLTALLVFKSHWSHWFSNQPRGLIFSVSDPRDGMSNMWFILLTPQEGSPSPCNPPLPLCPLLGASVLTWSLSTRFNVNLYSLDCTKGLLPVFSLILVRIVPPVMYFWCVRRGWWTRCPSTLSSWSLSGPSFWSYQSMVSGLSEVTVLSRAGECVLLAT